MDRAHFAIKLGGGGSGPKREPNQRMLNPPDVGAWTPHDHGEWSSTRQRG